MLSSVRTKSLKTAQEDFSAHSSSPTDNTLELGPSTTDIPFVNHGLFCIFWEKMIVSNCLSNVVEILVSAMKVCCNGVNKENSGLETGLMWTQSVNAIPPSG